VNVIVLAFLRKHRMAPSNTSILIRGQIICSVLMILDSSFDSLTGDEPIYDFKYAILLCYYVEYGILYWILSFYCVNVMILLSIDRFICIVLPFKYGSLRRPHFYAAMILAFLVSVILLALHSTKVSITHQKTRNATTFSCGVTHWHITLHLVTFSFFNIPIFMLGILNTITTAKLWKIIKNRSNLSENGSYIGQSKLSLRFSLANTFSTSFTVVLFFISFIMNLLFWIKSGRNPSIKYFYYNKFIYLFLAAINPIMYLILFRNFRRFVICKSQ